jgi:hypothetical protein
LREYNARGKRDHCTRDSASNKAKFHWFCTP